MKQEFIENIEAYLEAKLTYDELKVIAEKEAITDLDEKIEWVQNTILAIEADGLKSQLQQILPQTAKKEAKVRRMPISKFITGIAASLILVFIAYQGFQDGSNSTNQYAQYEYNEPGLPVTMSQSDNYKLFDALTYFGEEDYKKIY